MKSSPTDVTEGRYASGSFRDRDNRVVERDSRVFRCLSSKSVEDWKWLSAASCYQSLVEAGRVVPTRWLDSAEARQLGLPEGWQGYLEHDRIPFVSYPYEWSFSMLQDAALLQLDILLTCLPEGLTLKDASSYNVQWCGSSPVFIDVGSFERYEPGDSWMGYHQFCQLFLNPLLLTAHKRLDFQPWLRGSIDGIDPRQMRRILSTRDFVRHGVFRDVVIHANLIERAGRAKTSVRKDLHDSGFNRDLVLANLRRLRKIISNLTWDQESSTWADYSGDNSYSDADTEQKQAFVREAAGQSHHALVWDLGSNTGTYSRIAADFADHVVAFDVDHLVIDRLYRQTRSNGPANILPLVNNLVDPAPNLGWRNRERQTLADRSQPSLVLCLALVHHLVIHGNVRLPDLIDWLAGIGGDLIIEFVSRKDPMVQQLLVNKRDNYDDYSLERFESELNARFEVVTRLALGSGSRFLFFARHPDRSPQR
jgi:hypothetical protein